MPSIEAFGDTVDEIAEKLGSTTIHSKLDTRPGDEEIKQQPNKDLIKIERDESSGKQKSDMVEGGKEVLEEPDNKMQNPDSKERDADKKDEETRISAEEEKNEKGDDIKVNEKFSIGDECRKIWGKICPDSDFEHIKILKTRLSQMLLNVPRNKQNVTKAQDQENISQPCSLSSDDKSIHDDGSEELVAHGPGQTNYQQNGYSQNFIPSPGQPQPMASPPHDSMSMPTILMDLYSQWDQNSDLSNPVSPPFGSYPHDMGCDYSASTHSPQSISDDLNNIPTVIAKGMQVIVPGQLQQDQKMQELLSTWEHTATRDFDEQPWPSDPSSPSSYQGNPPSVSSTEVDSVFNSPASSPYNPAMSPSSGSTGSVVHSPAAVPITNAQWYPNNSTSAQFNNVTSAGGMTISTSNNSMSFGHVQVRSSMGSTGYPGAGDPHKTATINRIKEDLMKHDVKPTPAAPSLPSINNFLMRPSHQDRASANYHPYPPRQLPNRNTYQMQENVNRIAQKEFRDHECSVEREMLQSSGMPMQSDWYRRAQNMTREELSRRERNDPFEGEDTLQMLILNQLTEGSIAVINRMRSLNLSLDGTNDQKQSALLLAVVNNMPEVVHHLVHCGVDIYAGDNKGTYPIHYAATHGFVSIIHAMCNGRPPVNLDSFDFRGKTPLMCAVEAHGTQQGFYEGGAEVIRQVNNMDMVHTLMLYGAQPTMQDASSGKTALHFAIADMKFDMIEMILEGDKTLQVARVPMSDGNTPMHLAVALRCDQPTKCKIINYLVSKGADIAAQNVEKVKPTDLVTEGHTEVRNCLERYSRNRKR